MATDDFDPRWMGAYIPVEHWHFHRQLLARYHVVLRPGVFGKMLRDVANGRARLVERQPGNRAVYAVKIKGTGRVYVLADGSHVITVLPPKKRLVRKLRVVSGAAAAALSP